MQIVAIGILGVIGILSRYLIELHFGKPAGFPFSTLAINCLGSFLIGAVFVAGHQLDLISRETAVALAVGLLGGFTTFSAFSMQTLQLIQNGQMALAGFYFAGSPVLGLLSAFLGVLVTQRFAA